MEGMPPSSIGDTGAEKEVQHALASAMKQASVVEHTSTAEATGMEPHALPGGFIPSARVGIARVLSGEEKQQAA